MNSKLIAKKLSKGYWKVSEEYLDNQIKFGQIKECKVLLDIFIDGNKEVYEKENLVWCLRQRIRLLELDL